MIFVQISSLANRVYGELVEPILHKCHLKATNRSAFLLGFSFLIICLACCSCGSTKVVPIETIHEVLKTDTLYINNVQYDSIYVSQDKFIDRTRDTILIRQHDVEYRYKLLHDTIERIKLEVRHDSIPYKVRIIEPQQVKYIPPWTKALAYIGFITILVLLFYAFTKLKRF